LGLDFGVDGVLETLEVELLVGGVLVDDEQVVVFAGDDEAEIELKIPPRFHFRASKLKKIDSSGEREFITWYERFRLVT